MPTPSIGCCAVVVPFILATGKARLVAEAAAHSNMLCFEEGTLLQYQDLRGTNAQFDQQIVITKDGWCSTKLEGAQTIKRWHLVVELMTNLQYIIRSKENVNIRDGSAFRGIIRGDQRRSSESKIAKVLLPNIYSNVEVNCC
jgi:hypothetical protein